MKLLRVLVLLNQLLNLLLKHVEVVDCCSC